MHISAVSKERVGRDKIRHTVMVKMDSGNTTNWLWFDLPEVVSNSVPNDFGDPFLLCLFMIAMQRNEWITSDLAFSPSMVEAVQELVEYWHCMYPELLSPIGIVAPTQEHPLPVTNKTVACFSGGVDSLFTHQRNTRGRHGWNYGVFVEGVDDNTVEPSYSNDAAVRAISKFLTPDQKLYRVATNAFRTFGMHWGLFSCGYTLAAVLHWFRDVANLGLIPSTYTYNNLVPFGSHPIPDMLCSTEEFMIRHDGAAYSRLDKLKYLVKWEAVDLSNLRVCFNPINGHQNCGRCEKCIRTRLCFLALGITQPTCFEGELTKKVIEDMEFLGEHYKKMWIPIYEELQGYDMPGDIMDTIAKKIFN